MVPLVLILFYQQNQTYPTPCLWKTFIEWFRFSGRWTPLGGGFWEDEDYGKILADFRFWRTKTTLDGKIRTGDGTQGLRSILLRFLGEPKVNIEYFIFTLLDTLFSLSQGPALYFTSTLFSLKSERRVLSFHTHAKRELLYFLMSLLIPRNMLGFLAEWGKKYQ